MTTESNIKNQESIDCGKQNRESAQVDVLKDSFKSAAETLRKTADKVDELVSGNSEDSIKKLMILGSLMMLESNRAIGSALDSARMYAASRIDKSEQ